jgi:hypothetical protein
VDLSAVAHELYGLPPNEFTAARNARASEARSAGQREFAESLKRLRKPSAGAAMANLLVRDQPQEIEHLIELGATLRDARNLDGDRIREATREKAEIVSELLRQAKIIAKRTGLSLSLSVEEELGATLDAAFSDLDSAHSLRKGCLTSALHYSGLGFGVATKGHGTAAQQRKRPSPKPSRSEGAETKAVHALEHAQNEVRKAQAELETATRAVRRAEADLQRLRLALTVATSRANSAAEKESGARKRLDLLRARPRHA